MLASNIPCDICWQICYRSTGILDIQPYIQLHRPGKTGKQVRKGNEPNYHATWLKKLFSIHDFCTLNLQNHFILQRTFSLTASTVCLSIQPTPDTRSLKARMIPSIITSTWKGDTLWSPWQQKIQRRKSFELLYVTLVPTPNPGRRRFKNRFESCFLPFLCCPDRTHFW